MIGSVEFVAGGKVMFFCWQTLVVVLKISSLGQPMQVSFYRLKSGVVGGQILQSFLPAKTKGVSTGQREVLNFLVISNRLR